MSTAKAYGKESMKDIPKLGWLFTPGRIGTLELKNRIIMAPMAPQSADYDGYVNEKTINYYVARAKGGVGLIITSFPILPEITVPYRISGWDDRFIPGLKKLTNAVHEHGSKIAVQLQHSGKLLLAFKQSLNDSKKLDPIGPSAIPWIKTGTAPREITREDITYIVEAFVNAALRAKDAGFDAVEFHGAHGYLLSSFLSAYTNKRVDEYGGSLENRARFACEILSRTRELVGTGFPLQLRINGCDYIYGGITLEDTLCQAPLFVDAGVDALHVSAGATETAEWQCLSYLCPDGAIVHLAEEIKKVVNVPVISVGKLSDPILANRVIEEGKADFVAIGRGLLADPELPIKMQEGRFDDICRCIYCNNCHSMSRDEMLYVGGRGCTVNPALLREREFAVVPTKSSKQIVVIGGGIAGMEAARVLAERGHNVSLYEKGDKLGGQWNIAAQQQYKGHYASVTQRLIDGLDKAGVRVTLNTEFSSQLVKERNPDAIVVATGSIPNIPDIPGVDGKNVVQANDIIMGRENVGDSVIIIGGRLIGMETAIMLAERGKKVSLVTLHHLGENGKPLDKDIYRMLRDKMIDLGILIYTGSELIEIINDGVHVNYNRDLLFLKADTVVIAMGAKPENKLINELEGIVPELYAIGDCVEPRNALWAIREGAELGRRI